MTSIDLAYPRIPSRSSGAEGYESHYLTAVAPGGGRAVWIRYTNDKPAGQPARGRLWCTVFDRAAEAPLARRTTGPGEIAVAGVGEIAETTPKEIAGSAAGEAAGAGRGSWAQIDGATIGPGMASGQLKDIGWELEWHGETPVLGYLPKSWLYDRSWPRSNGAALAPTATFAGQLEVAGERIDLNGWRGMVGHNWGADHADRWIWAHVTSLGERDEKGWLDMVLARARVGRWLTPWLPAGAIEVDGVRKRIGLGGETRGLRVAVERERVVVELPNLAGGGLRLEATTPARSTVNWDYVTPDGSSRDVRNCSIASGTIELGDGPAIEIDGRLVVEVGE
ncbi:MAG TPA: hypothetical protein VMG80_06975 [Solirubrobacteraceae bacterium]|nr:hypothetical protein [Solirubrobacteraceae bacterium]